MGIYGGEELFKGAAKYYSRYRSLYPAFMIRFLVNKLSLDGQGKMLDLGCGTGQLAFRFSDWFEEIVGIDTNPEMIEEAKRLGEENRVENIAWHLGDLQDYKQSTNDTFKLVLIAKAFHWMDREKVLSSLYEMIQADGAVAIIDNSYPAKELLPWQKVVNEVVKEWYGQERRAGNATYSHPSVSHQEIIERSKFYLSVHQLPPYKQTWTVDSIIGNLYSTSYGAKRFLGGKASLFEKNLKQKLLEVDKSGVFNEQIDITVNLATKS